MSRLIDADKLKEGVSSYHFKNLIDDQTTVDAEPIRHGYWEFHAKSIKDVPTEACSECGEWSYGDNEAYCPHCGAKMDEVEE